MNVLKFSHHYLKMGNPALNSAKLLEVFRANKAELHEGFINFDTLYHDNTDDLVSNHRLPKGELIILLLESFKGENPNYVVWTIIRRYTPEKHGYYLSKRGQNLKNIYSIITRK